ncbi:MAG TPA: phage protein [Vicinamibacterales bacterium]|nr:phage protein [Vicinamibacterales bacterium]
MSGFAVYTATQVSINIGGIPFDTLMGTDEFLRIEKAEDDVVYEASADGGGTLNVLRNSEHTITLVLKKTSPANAKLSAMHKAGRLTGQGILIVPVVVVDRGSNGDIFATDKGWIKRLPDESYGRQAQEVEWQIGAHGPERFLGGH